tara:strand:- start:448 stop:939 length:492 start_codon:yes stop_codon:yes gene_type:complete
MNQGQKAVKSGLKLEDRVEELLLSKLTIEVSKYSQTKKRTDMLLKSAPYTNVYGNTRCRSEFLLCHNGRRIRIECKTQHSAGSVDEKLPYLFLNFTKAIPEKEAIIIIEGDGFKAGAKEWLKRKCKGTKVHVFSYNEFVSYVLQGCPTKSPFEKVLESISNLF